MYSALKLLSKKGDIKIKSDDKGQPLFKASADFNKPVYIDIKSMAPERFKIIREFLRFYGPNEKEYQKYMREGKVQNDDKMRYLQLIMEYWFQ